MATITRPEKTVLYMEKIEDGKSSSKANKEIKRDVEFEKFLSKSDSQIERLKKIIESKNEQIYLLKGKIRAIKSDNFKNKFKKDMENFSRDNGNYANTKELWRIISYLESYKKTNLDKLTKDCGFVGKKKVRDNAISFLIKINLIKQTLEGRAIFLER